MLSPEVVHQVLSQSPLMGTPLIFSVTWREYDSIDPSNNGNQQVDRSNSTGNCSNI